MLRNKKILSILILLVLSFLSVIWILYKSGIKLKQEPTPTPHVEFKLIKSIPGDNSSDPFLDTSAIEFYFSKPIDVSSVTINVDPETDTVIETDNDNTSLFIRAHRGWKYGTLYKIAVKVKSSVGDIISPIELNFKPNIPKHSPMDEVPQE